MIRARRRNTRSLSQWIGLPPAFQYCVPRTAAKEMTVRLCRRPLIPPALLSVSPLRFLAFLRERVLFVRNPSSVPLRTVLGLWMRRIQYRARRNSYRAGPHACDGASQRTFSSSTASLMSPYAREIRAEIFDGRKICFKKGDFLISLMVEMRSVNVLRYPC